MLEPAGDLGRDIGAQPRLDEVQHQVKGRRRARDGVAGMVEDDHIVAHLKAGEFLRESGLVTPMNRHRVAVEQPHPRQGEDPAADAAHGGSVPGEAAQLPLGAFPVGETGRGTAEQKEVLDLPRIAE